MLWILADSDAPAWAAFGFSILAGGITAWWTLRQSKADRRAAAKSAIDAATDRKKANEYADIAAREAAEATTALQEMTAQLDEANRIAAEAKAVNERHVALAERRLQYKPVVTVTPHLTNEHSWVDIDIFNGSAELSVVVKEAGICYVGGGTPTLRHVMRSGELKETRPPTIPASEKIQIQLQATMIASYGYSAIAGYNGIYVTFEHTKEPEVQQSPEITRFLELCFALAQWKETNPDKLNAVYAEWDYRTFKPFGPKHGG